MRKLAFLPLLTLALACNDNTPAGPELAVSPEFGLAQAASAQGMIVKMVPLKGYAEYWVNGVDWEQCEGIPGNSAAYCEGNANLTHLGKTHLTWTNCWAPVADPPDPSFPYELVSQSGTMVAANGDILHWFGEVPTMEMAFTTATSYTMGPLAFVGGTGRFENVQGEFHLDGDVAPDLMSGTINFDGMISSVGSGK